MNHNQTMLARLAAFIVWALVAACAVYWSLKLLVRAPATPAYSTAIAGTAAARGDLTRLLGAAPVASAATVAAAPAVASRFKLHGVMAPKGSPTATVASLQGVALISVDGKAPRAYAVGARVDSNLVLQSVSLRSAAIGPADGAALVKIDVPALPAPATGTLPMAAVPAPLPSLGPHDVLPKVPPSAGGPVPGTAPGVAAPTTVTPAVISPRRDLANSR